MAEWGPGNRANETNSWHGVKHYVQSRTCKGKGNQYRHLLRHSSTEPEACIVKIVSRQCEESTSELLWTPHTRTHARSNDTHRSLTGPITVAWQVVHVTTQRDTPPCTVRRGPPSAWDIVTRVCWVFVFSRASLLAALFLLLCPPQCSPYQKRHFLWLPCSGRKPPICANTLRY